MSTLWFFSKKKKNEYSMSTVFFVMEFSWDYENWATYFKYDDDPYIFLILILFLWVLIEVKQDGQTVINHNVCLWSRAIDTKINGEQQLMVSNHDRSSLFLIIFRRKNREKDRVGACEICYHVHTYMCISKSSCQWQRRAHS